DAAVVVRPWRCLVDWRGGDVVLGREEVVCHSEESTQAPGPAPGVAPTGFYGGGMRPILAVALVVVLSACAEDAGGPTTVPDPEAGPSSSAQAPTVPTSSASTTATSTSVTSASTTTATSPVTTLAPLQSLAYTDVAAVDFPIMLTARPGDEVALLAERGGVVRAFADGELGDVVLDISGRTTVDSERGLLGLARHPDDDGRLYAHYTDQNGDSVVSEFSLDGTAETGSQRVL